jgi:hypothetical protein
VIAVFVVSVSAEIVVIVVVVSVMLVRQMLCEDAHRNHWVCTPAAVVCMSAATATPATAYLRYTRWPLYISVLHSTSTAAALHTAC